MAIRINRKDQLQQHLNPSRRKISTHKFAQPPYDIQVKKAKLIRSSSIQDLPIKRPLFTELEKRQTSAETPQSSTLLEQNQYIRMEISRFEQMNLKLARQIGQRDKQLAKVHQDFKQLLMKYNNELARVNEELCRQLQQSRKAPEISLIRPIQDEGSQIGKSWGSELQIKETLDKLDFQELEQHEGPVFFRF